MNDLENRLARLGAGTTAPVSDALVTSDLAAAGRAARERGARRVAFGALATLGVATVAAIAVGTSSSSPRPAPQGAPGVLGPGHAHGLRLVDYRGEQQPGFTVAKVPDGYVLQGVSQGVLAVATADDHSPIDGFAHKLIVTIGTLEEYGQPHGDPVEVDGASGGIDTAPDGTTTLEYVDGQRLVQIQQWRDIDLTHDQLIDFAEGITVTSAAQVSHG